MSVDEHMPIAVGLLVRGSDTHWRTGLLRLARALRSCPPGVSARIYGLFKGFTSTRDRREAEATLSPLIDDAFDLPDDAFDIGAYRLFADQIAERRVCFLNGYSEPLATAWLAKLAANHDMPGVGAVGATASFESLLAAYAEFPVFPNPHLRSNAFMIERRLFLELSGPFKFTTKREAFQFESGRDSLSATLRRKGLVSLVIGRDGRGYAPPSWPKSGTFRLGSQANLLVGDNQTRLFEAMSWAEKREASLRTWGRYIDTLRVRLPHRYDLPPPNRSLQSAANTE